MRSANFSEYSFDHWLDMAQNDPERFEEMRMQAIEEIIDSAPQERQIHLRRLQWRIDKIRERSGTALAATIAISRLMWESFHSLKDHYQSIFDTDGQFNPEPISMTAHKMADVLPFRPRVAEAVE